MDLYDLMRATDEAWFRAVARTRWQYYGRFIDLDGASIMMMTPTHKVQNAIAHRTGMLRLWYLAHHCF